ncbi:MAG: succinyl-diaminopimelate desuccinylase [Gammaproteobacteria bacterium]|nr:succinyl-diaminopimelate desuccinylase [Gammaproteobacteria bacterium]
MTPTLELAMELIRRPSVTPEDAGCQTVIAERLAGVGFQAEHLRFGNVDNLWATRGEGEPLFVFAGHTDVVPPGPPGEWETPPFEPALRDGHLYGRGAADMKGSLAAMVTAIERFVATRPAHGGRVGLLLTSDEEGPAENGTVKVLEHLRRNGDRIQWCVVGEPSASERLGDVVKNGRRGSLNGELTIGGIQGHVAYPHLAANPCHQGVPALAELCATTWDNGNEHFPPTSFQISNLHAGDGAENVIPGELRVMFNFRYSTETTADVLKERVGAILDRHGLNYRIDWRLSGAPFLTPHGRLVDTVQSALRDVAGVEPALSTAGGTSDGRFIAPTGAEVVELGPVNRTIHQVNECVRTSDLELLSDIYLTILSRLVD